MFGRTEELHGVQIFERKQFADLDTESSELQVISEKEHLLVRNSNIHVPALADSRRSIESIVFFLLLKIESR